MITPDNVLVNLSGYFWPFLRISAVIFAMPLISSKMIPARVRAIFAVMLTAVIAPNIHNLPNVEMLSYTGILLIVQQILIGFAIGFVLQLVIQIFVVSGQVIAMQSGLGFASMVDPGTGVSVPLVGQILMFATGLLFFNLNAHLLVIDLLAKSFQTLPVSTQGLHPDQFMVIIRYLSHVFIAATLFALPVIFSLLLINLGFGVLARAAPQLNIFAVGFPITLLIGISLVYFVLNALLPHAQSAFNDGFELINALLAIKAAP